MMETIVSIGVCIRNCEKLIEETIDSITSQDFPSELVELIFVDDGSEDETLPIVQECVSRINIPTTVLRTSWKGLGHARNMVVAEAKGKYILWVDGDMTIAKDFVKKQVEFMEQHPEVAIAKGKQALKPGHTLLSTLETYSRAVGRMVDYQSRKTFARALGTGGAIYRKSIFKRVGVFDENLKGYGEDLDIETRVRSARYVLSTVDAAFSDYEQYGLTWRSLWRRYWRRGYYAHYFLHKSKGMIRHYRMIPPAAFLSGLLDSHRLFKLTHQKAVFLLTFINTFKMSAWYFGFLRSHWNSYRP